MIIWNGYCMAAKLVVFCPKFFFTFSEQELKIWQSGKCISLFAESDLKKGKANWISFLLEIEKKYSYSPFQKSSYMYIYNNLCDSIQHLENLKKKKEIYLFQRKLSPLSKGNCSLVIIHVHVCALPHLCPLGEDFVLEHIGGHRPQVCYLTLQVVSVSCCLIWTYFIE